MNSLEHILTLKQNLYSLGEDTRSFTFTPYLNQMWCKGEKKEYKNLFLYIKDGINYYFDLFEYVDKHFKNMLYPVSRGFTRTDHQIICAFDKYVSARSHKLSVVNYVCENIYNCFSKSDLIKLPPNISEIKIEVPDAYVRGCSKNLELNISNNRINLNFSNLELSSFSNNKLLKFDNIINCCRIKITVVGQPYSIIFLPDTYPKTNTYKYNYTSNNTLMLDYFNISYPLDRLYVS
jgi:hypothetical protein